MLIKKYHLLEITADVTMAMILIILIQSIVYGGIGPKQALAMITFMGLFTLWKIFSPINLHTNNLYYIATVLIMFILTCVLLAHL